MLSFAQSVGVISRKLIYKHLSCAQEIYLFFLSERSVHIFYFSIRAQPNSAWVQHVHRGSIFNAETQWAQNICSSGWLSYMRSLTGVCRMGHRDALFSFHESGVQNHLRQKPADSISWENPAYFALGKNDNGVLSVPSPVSQGNLGIVQDLNLWDGPHCRTWNAGRGVGSKFNLIPNPTPNPHPFRSGSNSNSIIIFYFFQFSSSLSSFAFVGLLLSTDSADQKHDRKPLSTQLNAHWFKQPWCIVVF